MSVTSSVVRAGIVYGGAFVLGFALFVAFLHVGAFGAILFYRGLVALALAFALSLPVVVLVARRLERTGGEALSACVLAFSLDLCLFIVLPVTIDRSVSVFMLGEMAAHAGEAYTVARMEDAFERGYVTRHAQIARRLDEQERSGNVRRTPAGYVVTRQGRSFIDLCRTLASIFTADPRLLGPS